MQWKQCQEVLQYKFVKISLLHEVNAMVFSHIVSRKRKKKKKALGAQLNVLISARILSSQHLYQILTWTLLQTGFKNVIYRSSKIHYLVRDNYYLLLICCHCHWSFLCLVFFKFSDFSKWNIRSWVGLGA